MPAFAPSSMALRLARVVPLAIAACCAGALLMALAAQHLFGLEPCLLCLYQRIPYAVALVLAVLSLMVPVGSLRTALIGLCAVVFLGNAGLAFYHVGVEQHWWSSIAGCGGQLPTDLSIEELQVRLAGPPPKPCDEVDWTLMGISLAGYNTLISLVLAAATAAGILRMVREPSL